MGVAWSMLPILCAVSLALPCSAERLHSPWDLQKIAATDAPYACPAPPAFAKTLSLEGYYVDKKYSVIDKEKLAHFNEESERPTRLGQYAANAADAWLSQGSRAAAACVYSLLAAAAASNAWADTMPRNNGVYVQNWLLSGTAIAYLKVRNSGAGTAEQNAAIQQWFALLAKRVRVYFDDSRKRPGSDAWNNHMYWAGLAVAAEGVADGDEDALVWGLATYEMGVHAIEPDGSLGAEMGRGRMALHYQLYALGPLILLAELAESNGVDLYPALGGAIHRLVHFDVNALQDPSLIARAAGEAQVIQAPYTGLEVGWAVPYRERFPSAELDRLIAQAPWVRFWQWGGAPPSAVHAVSTSKQGDVGDDRGYDPQLARTMETVLAAEFPPGLAQSYFLGEWCGQGRADRRATITNGGDMLVLRNELGSASGGEPHGPLLLTAPGWGSVSGALTPDRSQIDWSNGSYWARCPSAPLRSPVDLNGLWVAQNGNCVIRHDGQRLAFGDTRDCQATGRLDSRGSLTVDFSGIELDGSVTADGNHIDWQDGSYWTRATVYKLTR